MAPMTHGPGGNLLGGVLRVAENVWPKVVGRHRPACCSLDITASLRRNAAYLKPVPNVALTDRNTARQLGLAATDIDGTLDR